MPKKILKQIVAGPSVANLVRFAVILQYQRDSFSVEDLFDQFQIWEFDDPATLSDFRRAFHQYIGLYGHAERISIRPPRYIATPKFWATLYPFREKLIALGPDYRKEIEEAFRLNHEKVFCQKRRYKKRGKT